MQHIDVQFYIICKTMLIKQLNVIYICIKKIAPYSLIKDLPKPTFIKFDKMISI